MPSIQFGSFFNLKLHQMENGQAREVEDPAIQAELAPSLTAYGHRSGILPWQGGLVMAVDDEKGPDATDCIRAKRFAEQPRPDITFEEALQQHLGGLVPARASLDTVHAYFNIVPGGRPELVRMELDSAGKMASPSDDAEVHQAGAGVSVDNGLTPELTSLVSAIRQRTAKAQED